MRGGLGEPEDTESSSRTVFSLRGIGGMFSLFSSGWLKGWFALGMVVLSRVEGFGDGVSGKSMSPFIGIQELRSIFQIPFWLPCVFARRVPFPLDKVHMSSALPFVQGDCFYLVFVFSFDEVRWRSVEVGSMRQGFFVWH